MRKLKIGQIGIGHNHASGKMLAVRSMPELFEVVGYAEENEKWIEERGGLGAYSGLERLSAEEVIDRSDAVLIESDVPDMVSYARRCIAAGKHVHMDKPACSSLVEYRELLDSARDRGLVIQLGYMYRYNPAVMKCIEHVRNGDLGEIYSINAEMSTYHGKDYRSWLRNFRGGIMYILGSHLVDLAVYILGEPKRVASFLKRTELDGVDVEDNNLAVLEYDRALARIFVSSVEVNGWGRRQLVVSGSLGTVSIMPLECRCEMTYTDRKITGGYNYADKKIKVEVDDPAEEDRRYDLMMREFYAYSTGERKNPFTYEHDYTVHKVLDEIVGGIGTNCEIIF